MMQKTRHQEIERRILELSEAARPGAFYGDARELAESLLGEGFAREELLETTRLSAAAAAAGPGGVEPLSEHDLPSFVATPATVRGPRPTVAPAREAREMAVPPAVFRFTTSLTAWGAGSGVIVDW